MESESAPAQVLARFVRHGLNETSEPPRLPRTVLAAFLYIVRQLYSQCAGLLTLRRYELHTAIAGALNRSLAVSDADADAGADADADAIGSAQLERSVQYSQYSQTSTASMYSIRTVQNVVIHIRI